MTETKVHNRSALFKTGVAVILVLLTTIVAFQNTNVVDTRLLFGTLSMPHTLLVALVFAAGMLAGAILCRRWAHWRH